MCLEAINAYYAASVQTFKLLFFVFDFLLDVKSIIIMN